MTYLVDVPVEGGGRLLVQVSEDQLPGGLELAALRPGEVVARVGQSLEQALDQVRPAVAALRDRLAAMAPDEMAVEFGIVLGAETGVVVAKGSSEVHFTVSLTWRQPPGPEAGIATSPARGRSDRA